MKFLILGGNGYLGSKVVRSLVDYGHDVVCTKRNNSDLSRLERIKDKVKWVNASRECIDDFSKNKKVDFVLNMACDYGKGSVGYSNVIEGNLVFPLTVMDIMVKNGVKNFITIGTGLPNDFNIYSFTKKKFSDFGRFYSEEHNLNFCELKLEMFYGADEPSNRFIPYIIREMIRGNEVNTTIGTQRRDLISVDDVVKAMLVVIENMTNGYKQIPIGTGVAPSVSELVNFIWHETGEKSILNMGVIPMRKNEPDCVADTSNINNLTNWHPIGWQDGIRMMIDDIKCVY